MMKSTAGTMWTLVAMKRRVSFFFKKHQSHIYQWNVSPYPAGKQASGKDRHTGRRPLTPPVPDRDGLKNGGGVPDRCTLSVLKMSSVRFNARAENPLRAPQVEARGTRP